MVLTGLKAMAAAIGCPLPRSAIYADRSTLNEGGDAHRATSQGSSGGTLVQIDVLSAKCAPDPAA
jgi:hypothetical protein